MADLATIFKDISDDLKSSKIHLNPKMPFRQNLFIRGKFKCYRYSIFYCFKNSQYCVVQAKQNDNGKAKQYTTYFDFPRDVVHFVNTLKQKGE